MNRLRVVLQGYPLKSNRGWLGWCNVVLMLTSEGYFLFDTGSYGDRRELLDSLDNLGIALSEIKGIFLTHFHFDHAINIELFENAKIYLSEREYNYITSSSFEKSSDLYVPKSMISYLLSRNPILLRDNERVLDDIVAVDLPGHTPGSMGYLLERTKTLIGGDAIKNIKEFYNELDTLLVFGDIKDYRESLKRAKKIAINFVPGHDSIFSFEKDVKKLTDLEVIIYSNTNWKETAPKEFKIT
ncbi:beta-lactamase domain-containing protein [Thermodesulfobium narugense DSM 14796]|uniref:Beta-lactamase domain-containing protein n=1 Tax=Thermodesulfobium narugense DSM 14796 TaxID=747365 RepID=M1E5N7_9BACT|nr:MBL fold metallo-hydrolase [Thermodesulfobium narugense]AEE13700.1 beta-lactamase domain-containing protein [Thermodesulfobium narugense DSM 14796]